MHERSSYLDGFRLETSRRLKFKRHGAEHGQQWRDRYESIRSEALDKCRALYNEILANLPDCYCGCGKKLPLRRPQGTASRGGAVIKTFEQFISARGNFDFSQCRVGHNFRIVPADYEIGEEQRKAILGTLLGDTSIGMSHSGCRVPRLSANHGGKQREWAEHKARFLEGIGCKVAMGKNNGYGKANGTARFSSASLPCLLPIYQLTRPGGGPKSPSFEWLDQIADIGLAWWYCDDGSFGTGSITFHTEGYNLGENEIIRDWFCDNFGRTSIHFNKRNKGYYLVGLSREASRAVLRVIDPYIPPSMRYKLGEGRVG